MDADFRREWVVFIEKFVRALSLHSSASMLSTLQVVAFRMFLAQLAYWRVESIHEESLDVTSVLEDEYQLSMDVETVQW